MRAVGDASLSWMFCWNEKKQLSGFHQFAGAKIGGFGFLSGILMFVDKGGTHVGVHSLFPFRLLADWISSAPATILPFQLAPWLSHSQALFPCRRYHLPSQVVLFGSRSLLAHCSSSHLSPPEFPALFLHSFPTGSQPQANCYSATFSSTFWFVFCLCPLSPNCALSTSAAHWIWVHPAPQIPWVGFSDLCSHFRYLSQLQPVQGGSSFGVEPWPGSCWCFPWGWYLWWLIAQNCVGQKNSNCTLQCPYSSPAVCLPKAMACLISHMLLSQLHSHLE